MRLITLFNNTYLVIFGLHVLEPPRQLGAACSRRTQDVCHFDLAL